MPPDTAASTMDEISDGRRARALYQYFKPPSANTLEATRSNPPDSVLTAHAQLVAWRLNTQRALISLIDRETQYFVAESTKTLHLVDDQKYENPWDAVWAGCTSLPKAGRLCEHTLQTLPTKDGSLPCFEVTDLTKDERFSSLPFVTGPSAFRYYVGVPIVTKKGISIGSLFAMDDKVREPISDSSTEFLTIMAGNIMSHLEMMKEKRDRKRVLNMNMCLASFVDPDSQAGKKRRPSSHFLDARHRSNGAAEEQKSTLLEKGIESKVSSPTSPKKAGMKMQRHGSVSSKSRKPTGTRSRFANSEDPSSSSDGEADQKVGEHDRLATFRRAAGILRESLSLQFGGGVVLFSSMPERATAIVNENFMPGSPPPASKSSLGESPVSHREAGIRCTNFSGTRSSKPTDPGKFAEVLASSVTANSDTPEKQETFNPFALADLSKLIKRHPRGKLYTLDEEFSSLSSSNDELIDSGHSGKVQHRRKAPSESERNLLMKTFPGARQVIFLPLWDPSTSRWSACIAYNTSEFRTWSHNPDFLHCIAFCNCLMSEISRLATLAADQQKGDFIGSISHELRSPLHGILASCEFLQDDTETTSYQKSLVATADSCARTLLDTINMVLDYSKINSFERNVRKAKKSRKDISGTAMSNTALQPSLNIYGSIDLAAVTEEVVEGVAIGNVFKDITNYDATDGPPPSHRTHRVLVNGSVDGSPRVSDPSPEMRPAVEIIIDIEPRIWTFVTQPGAFRRIVMNLFGNALKYTKQGFIKVKLSAKDLPKDHTVKIDGHEVSASSLVTLTVSDSGQGISPEYMRTRLFTPFAQESHLNPGTGLGLSLVRSIITLLNGEINIDSTLGVGTDVVVRLPVIRGTPPGTSTSSSTPTSAPSSAGSSIERPNDNSLTVVRQMAPGRSVCIYQAHRSEEISNDTDEAIRSFETAAFCCFEKWYGFSEVDYWAPWKQPDIIFVHDADLPSLVKAAPGIGKDTDGPTLIVSRAGPSKLHESLVDPGATEFVSRPIGPHKLARCLRTVLERRIRKATLGDRGAPMLEDKRAGSPVSESTVDQVTAGVEHIAIPTSSDADSEVINVIQKGQVLGNEDSMNATMAMNAMPIDESDSSVDQQEEFPFPESPIMERASEHMTSPSFLPANRRPNFEHSRTMSVTRRELSENEPCPASPVSSKGLVATISHEITPTPSSIPLAPSMHISAAPPRSPRLLLVDDNRVNLRLLQTFMKKRAYPTVHSAEDGAEAVSLFSYLVSQSPPLQPDIIFMDISMPVMNGFEATRRIREIEAARGAQLAPYARPPASLVVALTGLASGRDQSEAFTSGFDLYMTKPVSFREVGRLLDNWCENGGAGAREEVPHGPVTGVVV